MKAGKVEKKKALKGENYGLHRASRRKDPSQESRTYISQTRHSGGRYSGPSHPYQRSISTILGLTPLLGHSSLEDLTNGN